jgi:hypothetical protein
VQPPQPEDPVVLGLGSGFSQIWPVVLEYEVEIQGRLGLRITQLYLDLMHTVSPWSRLSGNVVCLLWGRDDTDPPI